MSRTCPRFGVAFFVTGTLAASLALAENAAEPRPGRVLPRQEEVEDMPPAPAPLWQETSAALRVSRGAFTSVQVNVDALGQNIVGDAANEPSIAVDPVNPDRMVIGWRQFDSIASSFREAGVGYSDDGGATWTASTINNGVFRSDPVITVNRQGDFYYYSLRVINGGAQLRCELYESSDGGLTWPATPVDAFGGDKAWITTDRGETASSSGVDQLYGVWNTIFSCCGNTGFNRSTTAGASFESPVALPDENFWGTVAVGPDGEVYSAGVSNANSNLISVVKTVTAQNAGQSISFSLPVQVDLGGIPTSSDGPNPGGLVGQVWVDVDRSSGPRRGWVYLVASLDPPGSDPLDVLFARSSDGGATWSTPKRLGSVATGWQWFSSLAVSPSGKLDVIWADSRNDPGGFDSAIYHVASNDGGTTWSQEQVLTPTFDPHLGWPQQNKIGDYYHLVSDAEAAHLAYAATFGGEENVFYLRIPHSLFADGFESGSTSAWSSTVP